MRRRDRIGTARKYQFEPLFLRGWRCLIRSPLVHWNAVSSPSPQWNGRRVDTFEKLNVLTPAIAAGLTDPLHWRFMAPLLLALCAATWHGAIDARRSRIRLRMRSANAPSGCRRSALTRGTPVVAMGIALDLFFQSRIDSSQTSILGAVMVTAALACVPYFFLRGGFARIARIVVRRRMIRRR